MKNEKSEFQKELEIRIKEKDEKIYDNFRRIEIIEREQDEIRKDMDDMRVCLKALGDKND